MAAEPLKFEPGSMPFRRLGASGLRVPILSLGGWLTLGGSVQGDGVKEMLHAALALGINAFDTSENYSNGKSEEEMGHALRELGVPRSEIVVSTKVFYGTAKGPNEMGLSRKHVVEGVKGSLARLGLNYVDVVYAHRPDATIPMEEIVRAFNWVIEKGYTFYWATSEWSAREIEEAYHVADKLNMIAPIVEQCRHNMFHRRPEGEYAPLYKKHGLGTAVFSALGAGLLTGKYNAGVPDDSRFARHGRFYAKTVANLGTDNGRAQIAQVRALGTVAEELGCSTAQLAIAWLVKNPDTSTVVLGASRVEQLEENVKALEVVPKLTPDIMERIEHILDNKPASPPTYGRVPLDPLGRA